MPEEVKTIQSVAQSRRVTGYPQPGTYTLLQLYIEQTGETESKIIDLALKEFLRGKVFIKNPKDR